MTTRNLTWTLVLGAALFTASAGAAEQTPVAPLSPTPADCDALHLTYMRLRQQASDEIARCFRGPSNIGPGYEISTIQGCASRAVSLRAWPQCAPQQWEACEVSRRGLEQGAICRRRAQEKISAAARAAVNASNSTYETVTGTLEKLGQVRDFISDPGQAIGDALLDNSRSTALSMLTPQGPSRPDKQDDASAIARYSRNATEVGLAATRSDVVRSIQQHTFNEVFRRLDETLSHLDGIEDDTASLTPRNLGTIYISTTPPAAVQPAGRKLDCGLLADESARRDFKKTDREGWRAFKQECGQ